MSDPSSQRSTPHAIEYQADDPLVEDFEEFATRMLAICAQVSPSESPSLAPVIEEALQVHRLGSNREDGLPPHSYYEENFGYRTASSQESGSDAIDENTDRLDSMDTPYRMRWRPFTLYLWLETTLKDPRYAAHSLNEVMARLESYTSLLLEHETISTHAAQPIRDVDSPNSVAPGTSMTPTANTRSLPHLPAELVGEIVLFAHHDDPLIPFTISHVSRALRNITISYSLLWTNIDIMHGLGRAAAQLDRSAQAPLKIRASIPPLSVFTSADNLLTRFIQLLSPHFSRVTEIEATTSDTQLSQRYIPLLHLDGVKMPVLRKVTFGQVNRCSLAVFSNDISFAEVFDSPKLTSLTLFGFAGGLSICLPNHLVDLCIREAEWIDVFDFFHALQAMKSTLQKLVISHSTFNTPNTEEMQIIVPVELTHLGALDLQYLSTKDLISLQGLLATPNLTSLTHSIHWPMTPSSTEPYLLHVVRNAPKLEVLVLTDCTMDTRTWEALVATNLLDLVTLHLSWCTLRSDDILVLGQGKLLPCPNLSSLVLDNEIYLSSSDMVAMIRGRSCLFGDGAGSGIESLVMRGWDKGLVHDDDLMAIQDLVGSLTVTVFNGEADEDEFASTSTSSDDWDSTVDWSSGDEAVISKSIHMYG